MNTSPDVRNEWGELLCSSCSHPRRQHICEFTRPPFKTRCFGDNGLCQCHAPQNTSMTED